LNQAIINEASQKRNYPFITFILFWCGLTLLTSMYITIPLTSVFSEEFQITLDQTSWIGSSFSLCYALGCLLYGPISDKYGRKVLMVTSISVLTVVTFMIGFVHSYHALVFLRAVQGLVAAAFAPISLVYAGEMFPPNKRVTAVGFISTGLLMAGIIGQIFSGLINQLLGWNAIFFILGVVYLFSAVLVIIALPKEDLPKSNEHIWSKFKQIKLLFHQPQLLLCFAVTFMLLFTLVGMYTILGSYLSLPKFGLTSDQILYVRAVGIIGMIVAFFVGSISKRFGALTVMRAGLFLSVVGLFLLGFSTSLIAVVILSVIFVAGIAVVSPVIISLISQKGGNARGTAISFNAFVLFLGASAGPIVAVQLLKTGMLTLSFIILSVCLLIGLGVSFFLRSAASAQGR